MLPSWGVVRRVVDEEIEKQGNWWDTENCWVVVRGELKAGGEADEITPVLRAVALRTGMALTNLIGRYRPGRDLMGNGEYLTTSRDHRDRRLADGALRRIEKAEGRGLFEVYCPVDE